MLVVKKFGGTSVGSIERINAIVDKIIKTKKQGHKLVIVVSAMSGETNKLASLANNFDTNSSLRDMDMILSSGEQITCGLVSMALNTKGFKAYSLSGRQAGIQTNNNHLQARIENIDTRYMQELLEKNYILVVAGFQGINKNNDITTLGRGGSDLSAVAIAGALEADICEIYTDVDGIYTTDPRIEPKAQKIEKIFYDSMLELSSGGAKVLHNRSIELAKKLDIALVVRNSFNDNRGTLITNEDNMMEQTVITGIALDSSQARISIVGVSDKPGIAANIFSKLSDNNINIDMIVQTIAHDGKTNIDLTLPKEQLLKAKDTIYSFDDHMHTVEYDENISKVSLVGIGMKSHSGVASLAFSTLHKESINIMMISTSEIKISLVIESKYGELAVRSLHQAYGLDK